MCRRNCEYRGGTVQKWNKGDRSCGYSGAMMLTDQKYKTRTKLLWLKVEEEHPDWPRQRKQMWVIENLQGQNCPFFKQSDKEPEPEMEPVPQPAARPAKQKAMTIKGKIDDCQAMKLYRQGMTDSAMAEILKVTHTAMASWRQRHSLPPNGTRGGDRRHGSKAETKQEKEKQQ